MPTATLAGSPPARFTSASANAAISVARCSTATSRRTVPSGSRTQAWCETVAQSIPTSSRYGMSIRPPHGFRPGRVLRLPCTGARGATPHWTCARPSPRGAGPPQVTRSAGGKVGAPGKMAVSWKHPLRRNYLHSAWEGYRGKSWVQRPPGPSLALDFVHGTPAARGGRTSPKVDSEAFRRIIEEPSGAPAPVSRCIAGVRRCHPGVRRGGTHVHHSEGTLPGKCAFTV